MAFCGDAVGVLGVVLGTKVLSDADVTSQIARWAAKFLKASYDREGGEEWQRCLFAVAGRYLEEPLDLAIPESAATADVRTAMRSRGLVDADDRGRAREDAAQTLNLAVQEPPTNLSHDRATLRLAALEWVIRASRRPAGQRDRAKGSMDLPSLSDPIWTITSEQKGSIPVTKLSGEVVWLNATAADELDEGIYTPEDERRVADVTLNGRSELRGEIERLFGGPDWPKVSALVEPFRLYATKVFDVNAEAYQKVASTQERDSHEVLNGMVRALLGDVFGSEWESSPGEKVIRIDWQLGAKGWTGTEIVMIAGNDPDKNCLYHQLVGDAITYRYRFHAVIPPAGPSEPPGINVSNLEWWQYIGLKERHNLAMAIKPYIEDRRAHWDSVYASRRPTDATNGTAGASRRPEQPGSPEAPVPKESRTAKKPVRRNQKYEAIDKALREFAAARPKSHEEVFRLLEDRKIPIPNRKPFKSAGGWLRGFQQNRHLASVWLSQAWGRLGFPAFPRGPRK